MTTYRYWDGRTVHLGRTNPVHDRREFDLALTAETAAHLASFLTAAMPLVGTGDDIREVRDALDFVLIADEASVEAHRRMKAGRGMTPDGGYREPDAVNGTLFADVTQLIEVPEETDAPEHAFEPSGLDMSRCKIYVGGESGQNCDTTAHCPASRRCSAAFSGG
jgi:hypothetical protein